MQDLPNLDFLRACAVLAAITYLLPHRPLALQFLALLGSVFVFSVAAHHGLKRPRIYLGSRVAQEAERSLETHRLHELRIPDAEIG